MLECLGDAPCPFILIFDNGYLSEFRHPASQMDRPHPEATAGQELHLPAATFGGGKTGVFFSARRGLFARGAEPPAVAAARSKVLRLPTETHRYGSPSRPPPPPMAYSTGAACGRAEASQSRSRRPLPVWYSRSIAAGCGSCMAPKRTSGQYVLAAGPASQCSVGRAFGTET